MSQTNGDAKRVVCILDSTSAAAGTGAGIALGGYTNGTSSTINDFGIIQGIKENSTAGDYASAMLFSTRANGANPAEQMRITSGGLLSVGGNSTFAQVNIQSSVSGKYLYMDDGTNAAWDLRAESAATSVIQTPGTGWSSWAAMDLRANYFKFKPNNSEIMRVVSTGVGIATTNPSATLQVGSVTDSSTTAASLVHLTSATASSTVNGFSTLKLDYKSGHAPSTVGAQIMFTQGYHSGNQDYTAPVGSIRGWKTGASDNYGGGLQFLYQPDSGSLGLLVGMTLEGSGNVGIGTDNPAQLLEVGNDGNTDYALIGPTKIGGGMGHGNFAGFSHRDMGGTGNYALLQAAGGGTFLNAASSQTIYFGVNNVYTMFMTNAGLTINNNYNLYLGTTGNNTGLLRFYNNNSTAYYLDWKSTGVRAYQFLGSSSSADYETSFSNASTGGHNLNVEGIFRVKNEAGNTNRFTVSASGVVQWGSSAAHGTLTWDTDKAVIGGIGTNNLSLVAEGTEVVNSTSSTWDFKKEAKFPNNVGLFFRNAANSSTLGLKADTGDRITFRTGGTWDQMILDGNGSLTLAGLLGVNVAADSGDALTIKSTADGTNVLSMKDSAGDAMFNIRQSSNDCLIRAYKDGGSQKVQIHTDGDSYFIGGSIGIGDTAPGTQLDVQQTAGDNTYPLKIRGNIDNDGGFTGITFGYEGDTRSYEKARIMVEGTTGNVQPNMHFLLQSQANSTSATKGDSKLTILNGGSVGIGTNAPTQQLVVAKSNSGGIGGSIRIDNSAGGAADKMQLIFSSFGNSYHRAMIQSTVESSSPYAGTLEFYTGITSGTFTEKMRVDHNGYVGIGTNAPSSLLHVTGDLGNSAFLAYFYNSGTQSEDNGLNVQIASSGSSAQALRVNTGGDSNAFIVAGDGQVGVGFTPSSFGQKFNVNGNTYLSGSVGIGDSTPSYKLDVSGTGRFTNDVTIAGNVGINGTTPSSSYGLQVGGNALVSGSFSASSKSFLIDHPTKENKKLEYGCLEGPEFGVYHRGRVQSTTISLPDYWTGLVREETITVQLTPKGSFQHLYVVSQSLTEIVIGAADGETIDCFYTIYGERADIDRLEVEKEV